MPYRHPDILRPLSCALVLAAAGVLPASLAAADYAVVAGSAGNSVSLAVECREDWRVTAELVSMPRWVSRAGLTCTPAASGADVHVAFDVSDAAPVGGRGTLVVALQSFDAQGRPAARSLRRLPLGLAATAPDVQSSFQIEECCIPVAGTRDAQSGRPNRNILLGAVPNPWRGSTAIRFGMPAAAAASLRILDLAGRVVWEALTPELPPGYHQMVWDGRDATGRRAASGLYFYQVRVGPWQANGKTLRLR